MHAPVLFDETIEFLRPARADGTLVDATVGLGGHSEGLLRRYPEVRLIAIDRDPEALQRARERLAPFPSRVTFARGRHQALIDILKQSGPALPHGGTRVPADPGLAAMPLHHAAP